MKSELISLTRPSDVFVEEGPLVTKRVRIPFSDKSYVGGGTCFEAMKFDEILSPPKINGLVGV